MMEPTDNAIHAGCLGNVNATWTFHGVAAHSARPWFGDNAITRAAAGVTALAAHEPEPHQFDGLEFVEVASVTKIAGGIAMNVIPGEATAHVNYRYAPGRTPEEAEARLRRAVRRPRRAADRRQRAVRRGRARPAGGRADRGRRPRGGAEAGVDAGGGVRPRGRPGDQLRPRRPAAGAHARRVDLGRGARPQLPGAGGLRRSAMKPSPILTGLKHVSLRAPHRRQARAAGARGRGRRLRHRRAARGHAAVHPRGAGRRAAAEVDLPAGRGPAGAARRDRRVDRAALRRRRSTPAPRSSPRSAPRRRSSTSPRSSAATRSRSTTPGYPVAERGAAFAGKQVARAAAAGRARLPARPRRRRVDWARVGDPVAQLPEQPDRRDRARSSSTSAPRRSRASTTSCVASDEAYSEIYFGASRPPRRSRSPTAAT